MDKMSKLGKIYIIGFVIVSVITLVVVNFTLIRNIQINEKANETKMINSIYNEAKEIEQEVYEIQNSVRVLKDFIGDTINHSSLDEANVFDSTTYLDEFNITYLDETLNPDIHIYGNLFLLGTESDLTGFEIKELNSLMDLFELEASFKKVLDKEISYNYYSVNGFAGYFPFQRYDETYYKEFEAVSLQVQEVIEGLNNLPSQEYEEVIAYGTSDVLYNEETKKYDYIYSLPLERNNRIVAIIQTKISENSLYQLDSTVRLDKFYLNNEDNILLSSYDSLGGTDFVQFALDHYDGLNFYTNKFPLTYEIRNEGDYKLYILRDLQYNSQLVYVEKYSYTKNIAGIVVLNIVVLLIIGLTLYLIIINDNKHGNKLEMFIKKSKYDGMTDLLNHEYTIESLKNINSQSRVKKVGLLMMDIDNFKIINDTYGHSVGDEVIRICADAIRLVVDESNSVSGRYGGEEFIVILEGKSADNACDIAEDIRKMFNRLCREKLNIFITISIGIHRYQKPTELDVIDLINIADKNLYKAKRNGKNMIVADEIVDV